MGQQAHARGGRRGRGKDLFFMTELLLEIHLSTHWRTPRTLGGRSPFDGIKVVGGEKEMEERVRRSDVSLLPPCQAGQAEGEG